MAKKVEKKIEEAVEAVANECCGKKSNNKYNMNSNASSGAIYGLGFVGALVYFMQNAGNFQEVLFGILKAILWPAFLIYKVLEVLKF